MVYLTTHSTHFLTGMSDIQLTNTQIMKVESRKEFFFYLMMHSTHFIYGYMVSGIWYWTIQIVGEESCCHYMGFFYMHHPTDRITHTTAFVTPVVEHWLEWEIAQWAHQERMLYHRAKFHSFNESGSPLLALPIHELLGIGKHINMSIYFQDVPVTGSEAEEKKLMGPNSNLAKWGLGNLN